MVLDALSWRPDILVMHDGPDVAERGLRGNRVVREILEAAEPDRPALVVRGHRYWEEPLVELRTRQVLNVNGRVVVLVRRRAGLL